MANILIVDDDEKIRSIIANYLSHQTETFDQIYHAGNGQEALDLLSSLNNQQLPDVILLDWIMPVMNGPTFIQMVKADLKYAHIPVIFVTSIENHDDVKKGLVDYKADGFVKKPFNIIELEAHLKVMLRIKEMEDHNRILSRNHESTILGQSLEIPLGLMKQFIHQTSDGIDRIRQTNPEEATPFIEMLKKMERTSSKLQKFAELQSNRASLHTEESIISVGELLEPFQCADPNTTEQSARFKTLVNPQEVRDFVIQPIIDNAVSFSGHEPGISIALDEESNKIIIHFKDQGSGIESIKMNQVFSPTLKLPSKSEGQSGKSLGISMAIAKLVMKKYGGSILVSSTPGIETVFSLYFPLAVSVSDVLAESSGFGELPIEDLPISETIESIPLKDHPELLDNTFKTLITSQYFSSISPEHLLQILNESDLTNVSPGVKLIKQESLDIENIYFLISGSVNVYRAGKHITTINEKGSSIGEMAPLIKSKRSADVVTETDCTFVRVFWKSLLDKNQHILLLEILCFLLINKLQIATDQVEWYEGIFNNENHSSKQVNINKDIEEKIHQIVLYSHVIHSSQDGIIILNNKGIIKDLNNSVVDICNLPKTIIGQPFIGFFPGLEVDFKSFDQERKLGVRHTYVQEINGFNVEVEITITPVLIDGKLDALAVFIRDIRKYNELLASLKQSKQDLLNYSHQLEDQVSSRTEQLSRSNIQLKSSYETLKKEKLEKETALKQLENTQAHLLQANKMSSIGQLAAGVAHEINNPIGFISSNLGTFKEYIEYFLQLTQLYEDIDRDDITPEKMSEITHEINRLKKVSDHNFIINDCEELIKDSLDGVSRVISIVQNLKDFSHFDQGQKKYANINDGLESTLKIIRNELKYKVTIEKDFGELREIECFPQQINQAFMNILVNAAHAIEKEGYIYISTFEDAEDIVIKIRDSGCGIPSDNLPRIFEPFFTSKEVGEGTGLGLSMTYNIIQKHKGSIDVSSTLEKGTEFTIRLPFTT